MTRDDPRSIRSREAIVTAARGLLLAGGPSAVTHARVADEADVGRATVYRHWARIDHLLAEAMSTVPMPFFLEPVSPIREWIRRELEELARQLTLAEVRAVTTTLASTALWDEEMNHRRAGFAAIISTRLAEALAKAEQLGEVKLHIDSRSAAALAVGPIYYRSTIEHADTDARLIEGSIDSLGTWL